MIDWIHEMCREWGRQKRKQLSTEGRMAESIFGAIAEEGLDGAAIRYMKQTFFENLTGDALRAHRAMQGMPYAPYVCLLTHYVIKGSSKMKAGKLNVKLRWYWQQVEKAHYYMLGHLAEIEPQDPPRIGGSS